jgi:hypothetical protein
MVSSYRAMVFTTVIMVTPTRAMAEAAMETTTVGVEGPDNMVEDASPVVVSKEEEEGSAPTTGSASGVTTTLKVMPIAR